MSTHTVVRRSSDLKVLSTVIQCLHVHSLRIKYSSSFATNQPSHKWYDINKMRSGSDVSCWMWSGRERGACHEVGQVLRCLQQYSRSFVFALTLCVPGTMVQSRFLLRKHCRVGMFIRIDFLSPCCCAPHSLRPDSISAEATLHNCCMAQAVASKTFGSVVLSALPSYAYLILPGHRDTGAPHCAVARQHEHRES